MISSSLARLRLLAPTSSGTSFVSARPAARVDRPRAGGSQVAGLASWLAAGHHRRRHLPRYDGVSTASITSPLRANVTLANRRPCSSCGCLTGQDTDDDVELDHDHDDDGDDKHSDRHQGHPKAPRDSTVLLRLPGSGGSSRVFSGITATTQDVLIEFCPKSTLFDSSTHATRKHRRPRVHLHLQHRQQQQQQQFFRDIGGGSARDHRRLSCLAGSNLKRRRPGQLHQPRDDNQLTGGDSGDHVPEGLPQVPYRTTNYRNLVMVKPDPERRSVVHIVKSPSSRSQRSQSPRPVATVVDEEQLHRRFLQSVSERGGSQPAPEAQQQQQQPAQQDQEQSQQPQASQARSSGKTHLNRDRDRSVSSSSSSGSRSDSLGLPVLSRSRAAAADNEPPPAAIIIPPSVARSLSMRRQQPSSSAESRPARDPSIGGGPRSPDSQGSAITREQLEYGPLLRPNEVQVLYRSPETFGGTGSSSLGLGSISSVSSTTDRQTRDEQNKQVAPHLRQSPIAFMSMNPAYEVHTRPLTLEYPATVENLRMNNTGFCWEVKIPYQLSASTSLSGAHLAPTQRFRLDQFHCHWGDSCDQGSEHTIDNRHFSAEMHFVHYNMEKYHTMSKAARHPDGLVVVGVLIDAQPTYRNHAELEKVVSNLKSIQLKGEHSYIKQVLRIENLLPANRSYWSYPGSLTTPPYLESVTWFVLKQPIKCNTAQIERFRNIKSTIRHDDDDRSGYIRSNCRKTQPLNGRTIVTYDEPAGGGRY